jgi:hypothetical protein
MSQDPAPQPGNYLPILIGKAAEFAVPGKLVEMAILHDDWCDLLSGKGGCNCEPEVKPMADVRRGQARKN